MDKAAIGTEAFDVIRGYAWLLVKRSEVYILFLYTVIFTSPSTEQLICGTYAKLRVSTKQYFDGDKNSTTQPQLVLKTSLG